MQPLVTLTQRGLYCPAGDFYIDPSRGVDTAVVTHAHSDHARRGSKRYLCARSSIGLLKARLGSSISVTGVHYGERFRLGSVWVSLHPAGHILGSAQVRIESGKQVWVASGDYKREPDPSCEPFEVVSCDTFITEATFGTPSYHWSKDRQPGSVGREIHAWWQETAAKGQNSVLFGYSLGKAQRILAELHSLASRPVLIYPTIAPLAEIYRREGIPLVETEVLSEIPESRTLGGELILAPPSVLDDEKWSQRIGAHQSAFASGWMASRSGWGRGDYDHGFVVSDHADWEDLNRTIEETGAKRVYVQHRGMGALVRHLRTKSAPCGTPIQAHPVEVLDESQLDPNEQLRLF